MNGRLIILLPQGQSTLLRWRRVDRDGVFLEGGDFSAGQRLAVGDQERIVAVVPGDAVAVHWIDLPKASPSQAVAAARIMASELIAGPAADQHVAAASEADAEGMRAIAIVARAAMADWLARAAEHGLEPHEMVPASMLLPVSPDGLTATRHGGQVLLRGRHLALQGEPELVDAVRGTAGVRYLDRDLMDIAAESLSEPPPLNLRQGTFARPSDFRVDWGRARRMGWLVAGIVGAMLAVQVVEVLHYSFAARSLESRMETAAREVLPSGTAITDPHAQLRAHLQATGAGGGFARVAAALFEGLQASGARLETLDYNPEGALRATVRTGRGQTLDTLTEQLAARGYALVEGASRGDAEGQRTDIEVTPQ